MKISQQLGCGTLLAKIDLKRAFQQCPVRPEDWHLLGLHWKGQFYIDKCLSSGLRSSPFLFDTLASALEYIFKHYLHNTHIIHYLDDFLIAGPPHSSTCLTTFTAIEELCDSLGVVTEEEKRTPPATVITFLGIDIDTCHTKISPPGTSAAEKLVPPGTFAAEKSVRWGSSVAPHMVRPCFRWSPILKAFLRPYLGCRRSVLQFETLLASTGHRPLLPVLCDCIFTLANIYHKTMHNPNPKLNYLFLYHETNCDMNHPSYLGFTASAKYLEPFNSFTINCFSLFLYLRKLCNHVF